MPVSSGIVGSGWVSNHRRAGGDGRINAGVFPPCGFIATAVDLAMMSPAQRHGELIADLAAERAVLCEAKMMGIRRAAGRKSGTAAWPRTLTCSLSRKRRGSGRASRLLSMPLESG